MLVQQRLPDHGAGRVRHHRSGVGSLRGVDMDSVVPPLAEVALTGDFTYSFSVLSTEKIVVLNTAEPVTTDQMREYCDQIDAVFNNPEKFIQERNT